MPLPAPTQVSINQRFHVMLSSLGYTDYGNNKFPDYDDDDSSVPEGANSVTLKSDQKWFQNKTTESEESEEKIPLERTVDGRHVMAGEGNNLYALPLKKKNK